MIKCKSVLLSLPKYLCFRTKHVSRFNRIQMIEKLPHSATFETYAYDVSRLSEFTSKDDDKDGITRSVRLGNGKSKRMALQNTGSFRGSFRFAKKKGNKSGSLHQTGSLRGKRNSTIT